MYNKIQILLFNLHQNFWDEYFNHKFWTLFFIVCGITFYFSLSNEPQFLTILSIFIIFLISIFILKLIILTKRKSFYILIYYIGIGITFFFFGALIAKVDTMLHQKILINRDIILTSGTGRAKNIQYYRTQNKICFKIKNFFSDDLDNKIQSMIKNSFLRICSFDKNAQTIKIGDEIFFHQIILKPLSLPLFKNDFQFARNSYFENLVSTGIAESLIKNINSRDERTLFEKINQWRIDFSKHLSEKFGKDVGGIIAAITIGNREYISDDISDNMKRSSIFHLIAISGLHISFVSLFFTFILTRFFTFFLDKYYNYFTIKKIIYFISLLFVTFYLIISGISLSAQRAFFMFFILNISIYRGTQNNSRNIIFWTILFILISQPHSMLSPGLQMSILAVFALISFNFNKYKRINCLILSDIKENFFQYKKKLFHVEQFHQQIYKHSHTTNNARHSNSTENVPRGTLSYKSNKKVNNTRICSTWHIRLKQSKSFMEKKLFHVEQFKKYLYNKKNIKDITDISKEQLTFQMKRFFAKLISKLKIQNFVPRGTIFIKIILSVSIPHIAIMPSTLFYFQSTSTYSIISNIIAIPLTTFVVMPLIILNFIFKMFHMEHFYNLSEFLLKKSIEFLLNIGHFFAYTPFGYIKIHQISNISFGFMIFGLIWFLIWQKNWRFFGIFIYIIGIILLFQSDFPDFFIYNNKDQIHFIAKDDEYHRYSLDNNDFISKKILIQNNIKSFNKIQNVPRGTSLFKKNNKIILLYKNQYDESIPSNKHNADFQIILYDKMIENAPCGTLSCEMNNKVKNAKICSTWNIVCISIEKINKNGAYSIFIKNNRLIIKTGLDYIGNRPWNFHYKNDQ